MLTSKYRSKCKPMYKLRPFDLSWQWSKWKQLQIQLKLNISNYLLNEAQNEKNPPIDNKDNKTFD